MLRREGKKGCGGVWGGGRWGVDIAVLILIGLGLFHRSDQKRWGKEMGEGDGGGGEGE